jgi:hypothetical protein
MHEYVHVDDLIHNTLLQYVVQMSARDHRSFLIGGDCLVLGGDDPGDDDPGYGQELG